MKKYKTLTVKSISLFVMIAIVLSTPMLSFAEHNKELKSYHQEEEKEFEKGEKGEKERFEKNKVYRFLSVNKKKTNISINIPTINNLTVTNLQPNKATISWKTDVRSSSFIWYDKTSPIKTSEKYNIFRPVNVVKHKIVLTRLKPDTKYYFVVGSANKAGKILSSEMSFTTPPIEKDNSPIIIGLTGSKTITVGEKGTVTVNAYDPQNGVLNYSVDWGDADTSTKSTVTSSKQAEFVQTATFDHVYDSPGIYTVTFTVEDETGLKDSDSIKISVKPISTGDTEKPIISEIEIKSQISSPTTRIITWTTNEKSTSEVFYSENTPVQIDSDVTDSVSNESLVTKHSLEIKNLKTNVLYHFVLKSVDSSGNTTLSNDYIFTTTN